MALDGRVLFVLDLPFLSSPAVAEMDQHKKSPLFFSFLCREYEATRVVLFFLFPSLSSSLPFSKSPKGDFYALVEGTFFLLFFSREKRVDFGKPNYISLFSLPFVGSK